EEEYMRRVMEFSMWYVHRMVREEGITWEDSVAEEITSADKDRLLSQYRELAFRALYHAKAAVLREEAARAKSEFERTASEERLRTMLNSRAWRATQALKRLIGALRQESPV